MSLVLETAAAESAEGNDLFAGEVLCGQHGGYRLGVGAEPYRIAQEDNIIGGDIGLKRLQFRKGAFLQLLAAALDSRLEVAVVGFDGNDSLDIGAEAGLQCLCNCFGRAGLRIIKHQDLRSLVPIAGKDKCQGHCEKQDSFHSIIQK